MRIEFWVPETATTIWRRIVDWPHFQRQPVKGDIVGFTSHVSEDVEATEAFEVTRVYLYPAGDVRFGAIVYAVVELEPGTPTGEEWIHDE